MLGDGGAVVGIGDDAAVVELEHDRYLLATVDMLVEEVHFRPDWITGFDLGRRVLAVNLSDIAAMGGRPTFALASIAISPETPLRFVEDIYRGMRHQANLFGVGIIGGNTARTHGPITLDITLLGEVPKPDVLLRQGAIVGDVLAVTGFLGHAAASRLWAEEAIDLHEHDDLKVGQCLVPEPRLDAGQALAAGHLAHAMMDISDGLGSDIHRLADSSRVGSVIYEENLPISLATRRIADRLGQHPRDLALYGGEDYELLVALPEESLDRAKEALGSLPLHEVGTVLPRDQGVLLETTGGKREPLSPRGWQHF
jgi:thiamine-monophosphate kinase